MIDQEVNFEMIFPIEAYRNFKMGIKGSLEPGETYVEAAMKAFHKVMAAGDKVYADLKIPMTAQSSVMPVIQTNSIEEDSIDTCIAIYSCKELKVLESYKLIAKGKPELQQAYDEMYLKLSS